MKKLHNGWMVPVDDQRISGLLENDQSMYEPYYESKFMQAVTTHLPNKRTFVDVGANVGLWSLSMTKHFSTVVAYEPSKQNIECLRVNIPQGAEIREKAVADFNGHAEFGQSAKNCGDGKLVRNGLYLKPVVYMVQVVKLDDEQLTDVDMIKIDTQGWELDVVKGMLRLIEKYRPWVMIEINEDVDRCCKIMEDREYESVCVKSKRNFLWAPKEGHNSPVDKSIFYRYLGPGPYAAKYGG